MKKLIAILSTVVLVNISMHLDAQVKTATNATVQPITTQTQTPRAVTPAPVKAGAKATPVSEHRGDAVAAQKTMIATNPRHAEVKGTTTTPVSQPAQPSAQKAAPKTPATAGRAKVPAGSTLQTK